MTHKISKWHTRENSDFLVFRQNKNSRELWNVYALHEMWRRFTLFSSSERFSFQSPALLGSSFQQFLWMKPKTSERRFKAFFFFFTATGATLTPSSSGQNLGQKGKVFFFFLHLSLSSFKNGSLYIANKIGISNNDLISPYLTELFDIHRKGKSP